MALKWSSVGAVLLSDFTTIKVMKTYRIANHD